MKRIILFIAILAFLLFPISLMAAGSATGTFTKLTKDIRIITYAFTGDSSGGTAPSIGSDDYSSASRTYTDLIRGWYLYQVSAWPTASGTAPDEAGICVLDADGLDLLGSVDAGTTPYKGLKLIHATVKVTCGPDNYELGQTAHRNYYPIVKSELSVTTNGQGTSSANWTVELIFVRNHP